MYHKCKYTKKEIIQTNNLPKNEKIQRNNSAKIEKIQRNILKPACVVAVGVVFSDCQLHLRYGIKRNYPNMAYGIVGFWVDIIEIARNRGI